jgi:uncharacterized OB-fold protein
MMIQDKGVKAKVMIDLGRGPKVRTVEEDEYLQEAGFLEDDEEEETDSAPVFHLNEVLYLDEEDQEEEPSTRSVFTATPRDWRNFAHQEVGESKEDSEEGWSEEEEYRRSETPPWDTESQNWHHIEPTRNTYQTGWMTHQGFEDTYDNEEWEKIPDQTETQPITISMDESERSPLRIRYDENFERGICPHGIHFHSPETDCMACNLETWEQRPTKQLIYQGQECKHGTYFQDRHSACVHCKEENIHNIVEIPEDWSPMDDLKRMDFDY